MAYFSDDPVADFDRYDRDQERLLKRLPKCRKCKAPIQDEHYYFIEGEILCEECMKDKYQRSVEVDYYE